MKLKLLSEDLAKFQSVDCPTIEDVLGILQNVGKDIKKETGHSLVACEIRNPDTLMGLLVWLGKLYSRIYDANSSVLNSAFRLEEYRALAAKLQKEIEAQEAAEPELLRLQEQVTELRGKKDTALVSEKALSAELGRLRETVAETERRNRELEEKKREYQEKLREAEAQKTKVDALERDLLNLKEIEIPEQREKSAALELQKYQLMDAKRQIAEEIERFEIEIRKIRDETAAVEVRKKEKREEQLRLTERLNTAYGEATDLDEKVNSLRDQITELEQQLSGKSKEGLSRTLETRKSDLEARIGECAALEAEIRTYKTEIEAQEKLLSEKEETLKSRKDRAQEVEEELKRCESELFQLDRRKAELAVKENRLNIFKQIHQALARNAAVLEDLPDFTSYSAEIQVEKTLQTAERILENLKRAIEGYIHASNNYLEEIK